MTFIGRSSACLTLVILLFVQQFDTVFAQNSRPTTITEDALTRRIEAVVPVVEEILGDSLGLPVVAHFGTHFEIHARVNGGIGASAYAEIEDPRERAAARQWALVRVLMIRAIAGSAHDAILLAPDDFRARGSADEVEANLDVLLAHEIAHVYVSRRFSGVAADVDPDAEDELAAYAHEGFSQWVAREYARRKRFPEAIVDNIVRADDVIESLVDPHTKQLAAEFQSALTKPYVKGEKFVRPLIEKLTLPRAIELIFRHPPRSEKEIDDPAAWLERVEKAIGERSAATRPAAHVRRFSGRVLFDDDSPVDRATMILEPQSPVVEPYVVEVKGGRFTIEGPHDQLDIGRIVIGRDSVLDGLGSSIHFEDDAEVRIRRPQFGSIRVVDESDRPIPFADVVFGNWFGSEEPDAKRDQSLITLHQYASLGFMENAGADGVFRFRTDSDRTGLAVGASGHTWVSFPITPNAPAESLVKLTRSCDLRLELTGEKARRGTFAWLKRIRRNGDKKTEEAEMPIPLSEGQTLVPIERIPPGNYEIEFLADLSCAIGVAVAEISASEKKVVSCPISYSNDPRDLEIVFNIPEEWRFRRQNTAPRVGVDGRSFPFEWKKGAKSVTITVKDVCPGRLAIFLDACEFVAFENVLPATRKLEYALPVPSIIELEGTDEASGEAVEFFSVNYRDPDNPDDSGSDIRVEDPGTYTNRYTKPAPLLIVTAKKRLTLKIRSLTHAEREITIDVPPGRTKRVEKFKKEN
jgi:hypothetical protein